MVAFMLQEGAPSAFKEIESDFSEMFPSVKRIAVEPTTIEFQGGIVHRLRVYEEGIDHGIDAMDLSSGMFRALVHLIELRVAPPGSVLIVDEFENSLGANCLPAMTRALLRRAGDVQFILTSHHPYVINNIPVDDWKLVKRHGGDVSVVHAREVPALKGASHSVAFTRLINSEDYRNAIS